MGYYVFIEAIVGVIGGILIALFTKKNEGVKYNTLDKVGVITNIILALVYFFIAPLYLFVGIVAHPAHGGFLGVLGWIVSIACSSVALACALGLGASIALRKRGKSNLSFLVQFAGAAAFAIMFVLFYIFSGNLLEG